MAEGKSDQQKVEAKATTAARKAEAEAARRRAEEEVAARRTHQRETSRKALDKLLERLRDLSNTAKGRDALASHLKGFYEEIDKLAKGKHLFEVTPLAVGQANDIIRDAKDIIKADVYLDRIKEFVPAGNNPLYPDVLLVLRAVQECVQRFQTALHHEEQNIVRHIHEAKTIIAALDYFLDIGESPEKDDLKRYLDDGVVASTFIVENYNGDEYFDFDKLDRLNQDEYLLASDGLENHQS